MVLAYHPSVLPNGIRRSQPWRDGTTTRYVPLESPAEGELLEGKINVPESLCRTVEHTNERLKFNALIAANIERWVDWRRMRGWAIDWSFKPVVRGPVDPPTTSRNHQSFIDRMTAVVGKPINAAAIPEFDQNFKWYFVQARFRRTTPAYISLDDLLGEQDRAAIYGLDLTAKPERSRPAPSVIYDDPANYGNAMEVAEKRRQSEGLNRNDYLLGPLEEPL